MDREEWKNKGVFLDRFLSYFYVFQFCYLFFFLFVGGYLKPLFFSDIATILFSSGVFPETMAIRIY